jgi:5-oxoprolinase (ATP-hydrolysing) subunit A
MKIDINCDLGEGILYNNLPVEALIMPYISSANISCGSYAGNELLIKQSIQLAAKYNVGIGAHPGYADPINFGRKFIPMSDSDLKVLIFSQLHLMNKAVEESGTKMQHVKAHGALYNATAMGNHLADVFVKCVKAFNPSLKLFALPHSAMERAALNHGMTFIAEAFADRAYLEDRNLAGREVPNSLITDPVEIVKRCLNILLENRVQTISGKWINLKADTICIHGDNPNAPKIVKELKSALENANIKIRPI